MATYYRRPFIDKKTGLKKLGNYYIQWYENGKLKKESTGTKVWKEFDIYYDKWKKDRKARSSGNIMLSEFMQEVYIYIENNIPDSLSMYKEALGNFLKIIKDKPVKLIALQDIEKFKKERLLMKSKRFKGKFITKTTVNKELRTIKSAFNKAVDEFDLLEEHKISKAKLFSVPKKSKDRKRLTQDEKSNVPEIQHEMAKRASEISLVTGMRLKELCFFQVKDIKIVMLRRKANNELYEQAFIQIRNKLELGFKVKSDSERDIPINDELLRKIKSWVNYESEGNITTIVDPETYILNHDGQRYTKGALSHRVSIWMKKVGIEGTLHSCRHTFASELIEERTDIESVRDLMGHSTVSTTEIYMHSINETKVNAVNKLKMFQSNSSGV